MMWMTRTETRLHALDGGRAWWYRTTILGHRSYHAKAQTAITDSLGMAPSYGGGLVQPTWRAPAAA